MTNKCTIISKIITILHFPRTRIHEKPIKPIKKFLAFYGTQSFITAFTKPATCPYLESDQSSPCPSRHPTSWISIFMLSSHLRLDLPSCHFFPRVSPPKPCMHLSFPPIRLSIHTSHNFSTSLADNIKQYIEYSHSRAVYRPQAAFHSPNARSVNNMSL